MEIKGIKQLDNGVQKKPYADHIYHWNLQVVEPNKQELLNYCQKELKSAKREQVQYIKDYRNTTEFGAIMEIVCGGWYSLTQKDNGSWDYIVHYEYID